jgi:hypothetical protein
MGVHLIDVYFMDVYMFPNPKTLLGNLQIPHLTNGVLNQGSQSMPICHQPRSFDMQSMQVDEICLGEADDMAYDPTKESGQFQGGVKTVAESNPSATQVGVPFVPFPILMHVLVQHNRIHNYPI